MPRDAAILVLTGPTAAGKKDVGLRLAQSIRAEVVGLDSVKLYRGMSIGAASPSAEESAGVRMHLVGVAEPGDPYSVGRWLDGAAEAVAGIRARSATPLFIGGTPLYLQALLRGLFVGPPADPAIRARHAREAQQHGVESLHRRLADVDPAAAARILPRDLKRISRALEVYELRGVPISVLQQRDTRPQIPGPFRVVALTAPRPVLDRRAEERVDRMLAAGLVGEVDALLRAGSLVGEAAQAIGYREIVAHLRGVCDLAQARADMIRATRRLIRKQERWFQRFPEILRVERAEGEEANVLLERVRRAFGV